jgi:hypothetical protein
MAQYQKIEYLIGRDGKIVERVLNGLGENCIATTVSLEGDLGAIESQELLPEYYQDPEESINSTTEYLHLQEGA